MSNPFFERSDIFGKDKRGGTAVQEPQHGYGQTTQAGPQQGYGYQQPGPQGPQQGYAPPNMGGFEQTYAGPSAAPADTGRMTFEDAIMKCAIVIGTVIVSGLALAVLAGPTPAAMAVAVVGAIVGFVLAMVNAFKREPSPALIMSYAVAQGLFVGGFSVYMEAVFPGIVMQAVLGTLAVFVVSLLLYTSRTVRVTPKLTRFVLIALLGYAVFSLVNLGLMLFGVSDDPWGMRTGVTIAGIPLGVIIGLAAVVLAGICLIMDFDAIERGVKAGVPKRFAWSAAFGLAVTVVWLYLEMLRLIAILRSN